MSAARTRELVELTMSAEKIRDAMISIAFVGKAAIAALNKNYLSHSGPTDVISFGFAAVAGRTDVVGDIYISPDVARRNATAHHAPVREELLRLVVHGVLHVLGYEHPDGEQRYISPMWRRQELLLQRALVAA